MVFEVVFIGTCKAPIGRDFAGPVAPQFPVGTAFPLPVGKRVQMGRAKGCAIVVDSMIVQRHQAALTLTLKGGAGELLVENLGGGSQVFSDGHYIQDQIRIGPGCRFELGGMLVFEFRQLTD